MQITSLVKIRVRIAHYQGKKRRETCSWWQKKIKLINVWQCAEEAKRKLILQRRQWQTETRS